MDTAITIKLSDYDFLLRVLRKNNYHAALAIELSNDSKKDKLIELLQQRSVLEYLNNQS